MSAMLLTAAPLIVLTAFSRSMWLGVALCFAVLATYIYVSRARREKIRDAALVERVWPLAQRIGAWRNVGHAEVEQLAAAPEIRPLLYELLRMHAQEQLFPEKYLRPQSEAESLLFICLLHPNEMQATPARTELLEKASRRIRQTDFDFYVFRYRMPIGHWAGSDWRLAITGPFRSDGEYPVYHSDATVFSRFPSDQLESGSTALLVDWCSSRSILIESLRIAP